ncbi:MAG: hypothetical protein A2Z73_03160 [Deltaproteobacteria bacterium RBG_13_60_28]|nr:MAG: hypothetical protein A2Z73_03160 [Deltaproteobacteria bacterium RBG_13_60_28]
MEINFFTQATKSLSDAIKNLIKQSGSISIAVAYLSSEAIEEIRPFLGNITVKILCGVHGCISDLWALSNLIRWPDLHVEGRVFIGQSLFHSKLYIFKGGGEEVTLLIGSPNFTIGGLKTNEEIYVEIIGKESVQAIQDAVSYFNNLWIQESIPVESYLILHPEYKVEFAVHEHITPKQDKVLSSLRALSQREASFTFRNKVIDTLYNHGRQTIPIKYNKLIDDFSLIKIGHSISFNIMLPDRTTVDGKIRYGYSSWGPYYELGVRKPNVSKLQNLISKDDVLEYHIDILQRIIRIKRVL